MNKIQRIIQGLYGISESEQMMPRESARFTLNKTVECLELALVEYDKEIRAKAIDEFAHQLKETLNQEFPSNYESTRPYFSLENARLSVDDIAEQMKAGGK